MDLVKKILPSFLRREMGFTSTDAITAGEQIIGGAIGGALFWLASKAWIGIKNRLEDKHNEYLSDLNIFTIINENEGEFGIGPGMAKYLTAEDIPYYRGMIERSGIIILRKDQVKDVGDPKLPSGK